jgi:hypothetical protein
MSNMGLDEPDIEAPDADAAEQHLDVIPEPDANDQADEVENPPLEANEADAAEQGRVVIPDDDEYR